MAETVRLIAPSILTRNPENPRLIFLQEELDALQGSIEQQGILVPLTVFGDGSRFVLLDGERRWKCALKLGLDSVPVIVQPKPDRLQNIMMMFAIHNARKDWDPLPTALKLEQLEQEFATRNSRTPTEAELAGLASLSRGEVRRLKKLLGLPQSYRVELLEELEKPRSKQQITVDHVLETTKAVDALKKRAIITEDGEEALRRAVLSKFRSGVVKNTVEPRKLARLGRAVERGEVSRSHARSVVTRLVRDPGYSIDDAFKQAVEAADYQHGVEQLANRLLEKLAELRGRGYEATDKLIDILDKLADEIRRLRSAKKR